MSALDILRLMIGLPLVLLLPGWVWSLAFFPRSRPWSSEAGEGLDVVERGAIALALSIAMVSLGALAWNGALGLPLGTWGSLALVFCITAAGAGLVWWRRRAGPKDLA
jgi:uncharacterized membrane protein